MWKLSSSRRGRAVVPPPIPVEALEPRQLLTAANFAHPGVLDTAADFTRMATKVAANAQPWLADWNLLTSQGYAQLGASPRPLATVVRASTGSNYAQMYIDVQRAYDTALRWKVSRDTRYADQTVTFLNAWASTNTSVTGDSNAALAWGLYGFQWANIAEMMRTYSGWAAADQTQFQNYLLNVYIPGTQDFLTRHNGTDPTHYWANWDLCNIASEMAIGIFCDRHDLYASGLNYLYNGIGNGALDKAIYYIHAGNLGQGQEEGRDQGHSNLDYALLGQICQMAWNQGDDLFSYHDNEVLAGVEYLAKYNLGNDVPYVTYASSTGGTQASISGGSRGQLRPIFELFYDHYVTMEGLSAPYTTQALMQHTRPEGDNGNGDEYSWGTLIFALDPVTTVQAPQRLTAYVKAGNIQLSWWGGANDASFNLYRATSAAGPFTQVASGILPTSTTYTDQNLPAGTYYYKVTGVNGATETAATNVVQAISGTVLFSQLKFDESSGTTASDSTGNGVSGTLNGGASFVAGGKSGNALSLDGSSGYVSLPAGAVSGLADFTIATWVYLNASQTWARVFDFGDGRGDWMFLTPKNGSGYLEFATGTTYNYNKQWVDAPALATNQWAHVAVTFRDRLATLYVNGVAVGSNANMDFPPYEINGGMPNSWIGRSQYSSDPYLNGKVDDFRIYRGALTTGQMYTLATGLQPPTAPAAPTSLSAAAVPGNQVNLSWPAVAGATSYSVLRSTTSGGPYVPAATLVGGTTYADTGLTAGTTYYYVVEAANNGGDGAPSPQAGATALPPLPSVPTGVGAVPASPTSTLLSWSAGANDATYTVRRATTSGGPYTTIASGVIATNYTDPNQTTGTTYYYVIAGDNAAGESANSTQAAAKPSPLYLELPFDDGTATVAADTTGNGWNGTLYNGATWSAGKVGSAVHLSAASSQYVGLPAGVVAPLASFTIAAWVNPSTLSNGVRLFDFGSGTGDYMMLTPRNGSTGTLRFEINNGTGAQQIDTTTTLPLDTWSHVAVTLSGTIGTLYVNGTAVGTNSNMTLNPSSLGSTTNNYLGRSQSSADPYFDGGIDDFRVYDVALTAAQVAALAQATTSSSASGITVDNGAAQRSRVTSVTVRFSNPVILSPGALTLALHPSVNGGGPVGTLPEGGLSWSTSDGGSSYAVTFSGNSVVAGSIADGVYDLVVHAGLVQAPYAQPLAADATFTFFRLFGDVNGDGSVNSIDNFQFRNAFGSTIGSPAYVAAFDYNGDGAITSVDNFQFRNRFGLTLAF